MRHVTLMMLVLVFGFAKDRAAVGQETPPAATSERFIRALNKQRDQEAAKAYELKLKEAPESDFAKLVRANNEFAFDLYRQLSIKKEGNLFFCPYSISSALAMTYAGARGETATQMAQTLHFGPEHKTLHPTFRQLIADVQKGANDKSNKFEMANALWAQKGLLIEPDFTVAIKDHYQGDLHTVDFSRQLDAARAAINGWVADKTKGRINYVLEKGDVQRDTGLYLTNAINFDGFWDEPFPSTDTKDDFFDAERFRSFRTPFMNLKKTRFNCAGCEDFILLELPYRGNRTSMVILLPRKKCGLRDLEQSLTFGKIDQVMARMKNVKWDKVAIPKFTIMAEFHLGSTLRTMGMKDAFNKAADFSGITRGKVCLQDVLHKAWVKVDEQGTYAAAVTAVGARLVYSGGQSVFAANHPFVFLIRDRSNGAVLFIGRVNDPRELSAQRNS